TQPETDHAHVDAHGLHGEPLVLLRPIEPLDRFAEAFADGVRLAVVGEVGNQEAELVAAEPRVEIRGPRPETLLRQEIVRAHLLAQQRRDALDDAVADGVSERVVVPLEAGDVDQSYSG